MLLVGNGRLITHDDRLPLLEDGCVAISDGLIAEVGATPELRRRHADAKFIDARGRVIMPGLINTHMHLYSTFARGMALKDDAPENFRQILERLWWRLDKVLNLEDVYYSAMVPLIDCIKNGTTTIFDHHASPGAISGSLFRIADATRETGVRSCLAYEVSDRDGTQVANDGIEENRAFLQHCKSAGDDALRGLFGLHASFTLSDTTLEHCVDVAAGDGFHVHTAEGPEDLARCQSEHGKRIVERFDDFGILGSKTIAVHCVHVDENEIGRLRESKTNVVHNPESNMANAVGCAPVLDMLGKGVRVGLGTDGYTCDMFESLKVANILHKHQMSQPSAAWAEPPAMLFRENAAIASECFGRTVGKLIPGAHADLIIVDYNPPTPLCASNIYSHILFGMTGRAVDTTIIGGKVLMRERKLLAIDEEEITAKARCCAAKMWQRF
ncbi:MAG TPA: putative aminohydrolase SsnA [Candidatus Saccharimonadales bacterium]|nr:putative aminohydrolase SsnA [Candidatus Saccharimonadales bacterium]